MSRLFLIRHGPTHAKAMTGWRDIPADLSNTARLNALHAALPDAPVVSSDLIRAHDTANAIAGSRARLPDNSTLREMYFGDWEGLTWAEAEANAPEIARKLWETPGDIAPPGGESWHDLRDRVLPGLHDLRHTATGDLIIVAHFGVILTILQATAGWDTQHTLSHKIEPLSLSIADWNAGRILKINQLL